MDPNGLSDPYVKLKLIPEDSGCKSKQKTRTLRATLNPEWNEKFTYKLQSKDKDRRLSVEVWDWDRTSRNDFMGSLSFGISELLNGPTAGWFKLLSAEEGEYYSIMIPPEYEEELEKARREMERLQMTVKQESVGMSNMEPMRQRIAGAEGQLIRESDFTFVAVLGKGSFGKSVSIVTVLFFNPWKIIEMSREATIDERSLAKVSLKALKANLYTNMRYSQTTAACSL
ncbi:C2 domain protein [Necator americanus]|uniref:C2 domain protein n=1 Tax=Necator americanus TaxID=51031 RepID=W2SPA9_NECAM|nr:C2 domain protein [Necator americanus]ETN70537.1 C2 domain protein [Necator americanus]